MQILGFSSLTALNPSSFRVRMARLIRCVLLLASILAVSTPVAAQLTDDQAADLALWTGALEAETGNPDARDAAARYLVRSGWAEAMDVASEMLVRHDRPDLVRALAAAIRTTEPTPPMPLLDPLLASIRVAPDESRALLVRALAAYPPEAVPKLAAAIRDPALPDAERLVLINSMSQLVHVETVDAMIAMLRDFQEPEIGLSIEQGLRQLTGAGQVTWDAETWSDWWDRRRDKGRAGLLEAQVEALKNQVNALQTRVVNLQTTGDVLRADLLTALQSQYTLTPAERRAAFVEQRFADPRSYVRRLGLELLERMMANAIPVSDQLVDSVASLSTDSDAGVRHMAMQRLMLLDADRAASIAAARVTEEPDPAAAKALISVLVRTPIAEGVPGLVAVMANPDRRVAAAAGVLQATRAGLVDGETLDAVTADVLSRDPASLSLAEIELLAWNPHSTEARDRIAAIVSDADADINRRTVAARGLAESGTNDQALTVSSADPVVYPFVVFAVTREPTLDALRVLMSIPVTTPSVWIDGAKSILLAQPPAAWIEADDTLAQSPAFPIEERIAALTRVSSFRNGAGVTPNGTGHADDVNDPGSTLSPEIKRSIYVRLAELQFQASRPEDLLATLAATPIDENDVARRQYLRAAGLIAVGRLDEVDATTGVDAWLDGLRMILRQESPDATLARAVVTRIETDLASLLNDVTLPRFETLRADVDGLPDPVEATEAVVDPDPTNAENPDAGG